MLLSAETRVKQRPVEFASSGILAMVLGASWNTRWHLWFSGHGLARCILGDANQTRACSTAKSESKMGSIGDKHLKFPESILVFAAPCQRLCTAMAAQGILYSTDVHK